MTNTVTTLSAFPNEAQAPVTTLSSLYRGSSLSEKLQNYRLPGIGRLFKEYNSTVINQPLEPLLNLGEDDDTTTLSLKKLYLKHWSDPTEVEFVDSELGGRWDLWKKFQEHKEISKYIAALREEARARCLSDNLKKITVLSKEGDQKTQMAALKFLTSTLLADTASSTRGRPSKKEIQQRTNEILAEDKELQEAFSRVVSIDALKAG